MPPLLPENQPGTLRPGIKVLYLERPDFVPIAGLEAGTRLSLLAMKGDRFIVLTSTGQKFRLHGQRLDPGLDFRVSGEWLHESERRTLEFLDDRLELLLTAGCQNVMDLRPKAEAIALLVNVMKRQAWVPVHYLDQSTFGGPVPPHKAPH